MTAPQTAQEYLWIRVVPWVLALCVTLSTTADGAPAGPTFRGDAQAVAEVRAAYQQFRAARTWRARMRASGGATTTMEFVAPDRFRTLITQDGTPMEMYMIGRKMWMHTGGACQKLPGAGPNVFNPQQGMADTAQGTVTGTGLPRRVEIQSSQGPMVVDYLDFNAPITIKNPPC